MLLLAGLLNRLRQVELEVVASQSKLLTLETYVAEHDSAESLFASSQTTLNGWMLLVIILGAPGLKHKAPLRLSFYIIFFLFISTAYFCVFALNVPVQYKTCRQVRGCSKATSLFRSTIQVHFWLSYSFASLFLSCLSLQASCISIFAFSWLPRTFSTKSILRVLLRSKQTSMVTRAQRRWCSKTAISVVEL